ncbi:MAG: GGDEF domain-containing protein [Bacillota bacterium]
MGNQVRSKKPTGMNLNIFHILLALSLASLLFLTVLLNQKQTIVDSETAVIAQLDLINSNLQRATKLELEDNQDDDLLLLINEMMRDIFYSDDYTHYFAEQHQYSHLFQAYELEYITFMQAITDYRTNGDRDDFFAVSENHYTVSYGITKELAVHIEDLTEKIDSMTTILIVNIVVVVLLLLQIALSTHHELKKNKALTEEIFLDTSTGLYNRAKCQEILKQTNFGHDKERAIIIFDLNDLKKTNDNLGHRAGDDLIASFAAQLKAATNISMHDIFVGRYGGDEFMAYLDSVQEKDVQSYLDEVEALLDNFNKTSHKPFSLSCAAGYGITTPDTREKTMRALFDEADVKMYENKIAMKKRKREEEARQGIVEESTVEEGIVKEEVADSRL